MKNTQQNENKKGISTKIAMWKCFQSNGIRFSLNFQNVSLLEDEKINNSTLLQNNFFNKF